ncbi:hypothetical protein DOT_1556 [Desulfosporosinus sp. OT]|nr:hypothetical protein DOT_1556 [Desulfosporosinus sp. OT]
MSLGPIIKPSKRDGNPKDKAPIINEPNSPGIISPGSPSFLKNLAKLESKVVIIKMAPAVLIKVENKGII